MVLGSWANWSSWCVMCVLTQCEWFTSALLGRLCWLVVGITSPITVLVNWRIISKAGAMSVSLVTIENGVFECVKGEVDVGLFFFEFPNISKLTVSWPFLWIVFVNKFCSCLNQRVIPFNNFNSFVMMFVQCGVVRVLASKRITGAGCLFQNWCREIFQRQLAKRIGLRDMLGGGYCRWEHISFKKTKQIQPLRWTSF